MKNAPTCIAANYICALLWFCIQSNPGDIIACVCTIPVVLTYCISFIVLLRRLLLWKLTVAQALLSLFGFGLLIIILYTGHTHGALKWRFSRSKVEFERLAASVLSGESVGIPKWVGSFLVHNSFLDMDGRPCFVIGSGFSDAGVCYGSLERSNAGEVPIADCWIYKSW